jgi:hypothetical protein
MIFQCPTSDDLIGTVVIIVVLMFIEMIQYLLAGSSRTRRLRFTVQLILQFLYPFFRPRFRLTLLLGGVLLLVLLIGRDWPWRKWKDSLTNRLSGLTEVARASLRQQQAEAWS